METKTEEKEEVQETPPTNEKKKQQKELYWVLGVMIVLILVFLLSNSVFKSMQTFSYQGLSFAKEKFGEIPVYHYYYIFKTPSSLTGQVTSEFIKYNLFLRVDPRENNVSVDGEIYLVQGVQTYVSVNPTNLTQCENSSIAIANLASFINGLVVAPAKSASPIEEIANQSNVPYVTCENYLSEPRILIQAGEQSLIKKENTNCYVLTVANCEILEVTEKLIVQAIVDAKARKSF